MAKRDDDDIVSRTEREISDMRATVARMDDVEEILGVVQTIRRLESLVADLLVERSRAGQRVTNRATNHAVAIRSNDVVGRRSGLPVVRKVSSPVPESAPDHWETQRCKALGAVARVYAAIVQSREDGLD